MYEGIFQTVQINTPAILTDATGIAANTERKGWSIQNQDTDVLYVRLGGTASDTVFHFVLKGCAAAKDGTGGSISQTSGTIYTGVISVAGTTPSYTVMEM